MIPAQNQLLKKGKKTMFSCRLLSSIGSKCPANKENIDPNSDSEITGSAKINIPSPKRRRQNLDRADVKLIKNGEMLNDAIINKAQTLLHEQFPGVGCLEETTLGPVRIFFIQKGEFVQVLHDGSIHWVCISNIGCKEHEVNYYDSLSGSSVSWSVPCSADSVHRSRERV